MFDALKQNFFSVKTIKKFVVYLIVGCAIALLFAASADSKTNISSSTKKEIVTEQIAQVNPGDGIVRELGGLLEQSRVDVTYFFIEGSCHGQNFYREYGDPRANNNSKIEVASNHFITNNKAGNKQFNDIDNWLASQFKEVLNRNGFAGSLIVRGWHHDGKYCEIIFEPGGCRGDYCPI